MKRLLLLFFSLVSTISFAQNKVFLEKIDTVPTAPGSPIGEITKREMDKEGGHLISADGKIELAIPAGALSSTTSVSIQSVSNMAMGAVDNAFRLEPSGIVFQKPVQLIFHYTDKDLNGDPPQLLSIAYQNEKGVWCGLRKSHLDTVTKTLTGNIEHFSDWVLRWSVWFEPKVARVKVNKETSFYLNISHIPELDEDEIREDREAIFGKNRSNPKEWLANDIVWGDAVNGTISLIVGADYKAPALVPEKNPVEIKFRVTGALDLMDRPFVLEKKALAWVYDDEYEVKMVAAIIGGSPKAWGGIVTYRDEGSFIVSLDNNKPAVINIKNHFEVMTDNCTKIILNPNTNTGLLHVAGTRQIKVTPANPPSQPYPIVEIFFTPYPIELTRFRYTCPPPPDTKESAAGKIDLSQMAMMMFMGKPAMPQYIKFIAKDEEQIILESPKGVKEIYYKIWVKKIKEE